MDIYSRKIVGWEVYENESSKQAADVLRKARFSEALPSNYELVLHSDNGSPMKGATMLATMQKMGVVPSKPFESLDDARQWVATFCGWYNHSHRHSGLKFVTPVQRHNGEDVSILEQRKFVYEEAKKMHPERWSGKNRNWSHETIVKLNPVNEQPQNIEMKKAA
jgi:transposase InsO family protein